MSTLHTCPKCGTAMEPTTTELLPTRDALIASLAAAQAERDEAKRDAELAKMRANGAALEVRRELLPKLEKAKAERDEAVRMLRKCKYDDESSGERYLVLDHEAIDAFLARIGGGKS